MGKARRGKLSKSNLFILTSKQRQLLSFKSFFLRLGIVRLLKQFSKRVCINRTSSCGRSHGKVVVRGKRSLQHFFIPRSFLPKQNTTFTLISSIYNFMNPASSLSLVLGTNNVVQYHFSSLSNSFGTTLYNLQARFRKSLVLQKSKLKYSGSIACLANIPIGTYIHNISTIPKQGPTLVRSAGCRAQILLKKKYKSRYYAGLKMPSGKEMFVNLKCFAYLGDLSSSPSVKYKTAGYAFRRGSRPVVRGVAMNPIDHPHGGGEGKKSNPAFPKTKCGRPAKFVKTLSSDRILKKSRFIFRMKHRARSIFI